MKTKHLLHILEEQSFIRFTGKINILREDKGLFGFILLKDGDIVAAQKDMFVTIEFLYTFAFNDLEENECFFYVVEPEVVEKEQVVFKISFGAFKQKLAKDYSEYQKIKKLRPPKHLALVPKVDFLQEKLSMAPELFDLLGVISEYSLVADIFDHSPFSPLNTIKFLVSLRKMGAIAVYSASNS